MVTWNAAVTPCDPHADTMLGGGPSYLVRETVHHGTYYAVRVVALTDLADDALADMFNGCPYVTGDAQLDRTMRNAAEPLRITGTAEHETDGAGQ